MPVASPQVYPVSTGTLTTALTTAFVTPIGINILNNSLQPASGVKAPTDARFGVRISAIYVHVHAIAAGCTALTIRVSPDATADEILVPDTQATLSTGFTNAARGGVVFKVDVDAYLETPSLFVTVKTNAGTANLKYVNVILEKA